MRVIEIKELEDCFDGSFMKEALLDTNVTKEIIYFLGEDGKLDYYPDFARPFYKIEVKGKYIIKGVEGNKTIRVILDRGGVEHAQKQFVEAINKYKL